MSPSEQAMDRGDFKWLAVEGLRGNVLFRVVFEDPLPVTLELFYQDDALAEDPPEEHPGQYGNMGWELKNLKELKKGRYRYRTLVYFPESLGPAGKEQCLNAYDQPLEVSARSLQR